MDKEDILQEEEYPMNPLDRYPENADDEAILNAMRMERMVANDRWQSTLFRDTVGGEWVGSYEAFSPGKSPTGDFELVPLCKGSVSCCVDAGDFETKVRFVFTGPHFNKNFLCSSVLNTQQP
jgi:hypothetical protein